MENHSEVPVYVVGVGLVGARGRNAFKQMKRLDADDEKLEPGAVARWRIPKDELPPDLRGARYAWASTGSGRFFTSHPALDPRRVLCRIRFSFPRIDRLLDPK